MLSSSTPMRGAQNARQNLLRVGVDSSGLAIVLEDAALADQVRLSPVRVRPGNRGVLGRVVPAPAGARAQRYLKHLRIVHGAPPGGRVEDGKQHATGQEAVEELGETAQVCGLKVCGCGQELSSLDISVESCDCDLTQLG
jgi:hypothetical protein